ncbi:MAG: glycosyltransferase [Kineosporiaceae bacterium]|nr:glycosyltransferase [Kineosporiaceae bacterium]
MTDRPATGPHVLYVAWGFPPSRTGGVHRALATANAFAADGWQVSVLTAPREVFRDVTGSDDALERLVDRRVEVIRVPFSWPAKSTDLTSRSDWPAGRVFAPRLWNLRRTRRDLAAFPEVGYGPWRHRIERAALDLHARAPIDLVMATTNPQVSITCGLRLAQTHGVPYVVDFRDAWTFHTYSGTRRIPGDSPAGQWEARAIRGATEVWFVNEALRRWHAGTYPDAADHLHVVMNGYDRDLPEPVARQGRSPLTFGYLGTLTPVVPLRELVEGWQYAVAGPDPAPELDGARAELRGYLGYYATPDPDLAALVDRAAPHRMSYGGPVSKTEVAGTYAAFDVLILALGGGEYVTSGKVFEYASTGLPVVSVLTEGNAAAEVLAAYPRWHPAADLSGPAIAAALASAARDARSPDAAERARLAQQAARAFRRDVQLAPRVAALRELVTARRREGVAR